MVIIRINLKMDQRAMAGTVKEIHAQAKKGVIVLPPWCELLNEVPAGEEIQIIQQKDGDRVAELEQQMATALADLSKTRSCDSCKHEPVDPYQCYTTGYNCAGCTAGGCVCETCDPAAREKWEWRGSHGAE